mmetsp:Transcript_16118/g.32647  ORF Transcript_16118/g.32647 Transcript_16118/m.32647 type:complete len:266 (+) Transcript_16118:1292-2089(+)
MSAKPGGTEIIIVGTATSPKMTWPSSKIQSKPMSDTAAIPCANPSKINNAPKNIWTWYANSRLNPKTVCTPTFITINIGSKPATPADKPKPSIASCKVDSTVSWEMATSPKSKITKAKSKMATGVILPTMGFMRNAGGRLRLRALTTTGPRSNKEHSKRNATMNITCGKIGSVTAAPDTKFMVMPKSSSCSHGHAQSFTKPKIKSTLVKSSTLAPLTARTNCPSCVPEVAPAIDTRVVLTVNGANGGSYWFMSQKAVCEPAATMA